MVARLSVALRARSARSFSSRRRSSRPPTWLCSDGGRTRSFFATRASVSASHPWSSAIFAAARTTASLSIPTAFAILSVLHKFNYGGRDDVGILDVRIVSGAIDHQFFSVQMSRDPIGFGGRIIEVRGARAHHDHNTRVNLG